MNDMSAPGTFTQKRRSPEEKKELVGKVDALKAKGKTTPEACAEIGIKEGQYYSMRGPLRPPGQPKAPDVVPSPPEIPSIESDEEEEYLTPDLIIAELLGTDERSKEDQLADLYDDWVTKAVKLCGSDREGAKQAGQLLDHFLCRIDEIMGISAE